MTLQQQQRRLFIKGTLAGGAVLAAAGLVLPRLAMAAWPADAFHATTLDDALTKVFGSSALEASDKVVLKAPGIAENGAVVPISINAEQLENVESISIFSEKNPMSEVKLRAALKDGKCEVKALMTHPMETGRRKDPQGAVIPAHYIETVELLHNGNLMLEADWGGAISTNPFFSVSLKNVAVGDSIEVRWVDNKGEKSSGTVKVK